MNARQIRIVVIDPHAIVLEAMAALISARADMTLLAAETSARLGLSAIAGGKPDVAVIADHLRDINGLVFVERVVNDHPMTKVVVLSMHEDRALVQRALRLGAKAYVSKRSRVEHLLEAIVAAAEGTLYVDPVIASKIADEPSSNCSSNKRSGVASSYPSLTKREADAVRLTALGHTAKEIAEQLGVSVKTVETLKSRIFEKLDLRTRAQLVRYAAAQGWLTQF
jgi:DNA-binding NarL/FixJ family response regulator